MVLRCGVSPYSTKGEFVGHKHAGQFSCCQPRLQWVAIRFKIKAIMIKNMLIALIVAFVLFEIIEHVVVPLVGFLLGRKRRSISGVEGMVGKVVKVKQWNTTEGQVFVNGELWRANCGIPLVKGDKAIIHSVEGLTLKVEPFTD